MDKYTFIFFFLVCAVSGYPLTVSPTVYPFLIESAEEQSDDSDDYAGDDGDVDEDGAPVADDGYQSPLPNGFNGLDEGVRADLLRNFLDNEVVEIPTDYAVRTFVEIFDAIVLLAQGTQVQKESKRRLLQKLQRVVAAHNERMEQEDPVFFSPIFPDGRIGRAIAQINA